MLLLEDELTIQESKILWRWDKKLIPKSLSTIVNEKQDRLRGRWFVMLRKSKTGSINQRLTKRANLNIQEISSANSKEILTNRLKRQILHEKYNFNCRARNCFICNFV